MRNKRIALDAKAIWNYGQIYTYEITYQFKKDCVIKSIAIVNNIDNTAIEIIDAIVIGGVVVIPAHKNNFINNVSASSLYPEKLFINVKKGEIIKSLFDKSVTVVINIKEDE